jgi:F-type H+-transporting ATPase subunit b
MTSSGRLRRVGFLLAELLLASAAFAQEEGHAEKTVSGLEPTTQTILLWVNFAILFAGLAYLAKKYAGPFFAARAAGIQREMVEAAKARQDADARAADVDRRLANLDADLAALRAESRQELEALESRASSRAAAEIAKIQNNAEQEIAAAAKAARQELKGYAASLAVSLAAEKVRGRMTPNVQQALVSDFTRNIGNSAAQPRS